MLRTLIIVLALTWAHAAPAHAEAPTAPSAFLSKTDCFQTTPDYESWVASIVQRTGAAPVSKAQLESLVPARMFAFARAAFDCHVVTYDSGGHTVSGYVVRPKGDDADRLPLLVYNRGGNGAFGRLDALQLFQTLLPLAKAGHVVVASQYRDADEFGGRDVDDVMRLIDLSRTLPGTDGERVFLLGQSRGAMMSYLVARRRSDITAMATIAGATDLCAGLAWRPEMERVYRARIPGYADDKQAALRERSALRWAEHLPGGMPVLLLHGEADDRVSVDDSRAMAARLRQLDRPHRLVVYPGDDHSLRQNRRAAHAEIVAWFRSAGTAAAEASGSRSSPPAVRRSAEQPATASTGPTGAEHEP